MYTNFEYPNGVHKSFTYRSESHDTISAGKSQEYDVQPPMLGNLAKTQPFTTARLYATRGPFLKDAFLGTTMVLSAASTLTAKACHSGKCERHRGMTPIESAFANRNTSRTTSDRTCPRQPVTCPNHLEQRSTTQAKPSGSESGSSSLCGLSNASSSGPPGSSRSCHLLSNLA